MPTKKSNNGFLHKDKPSIGHQPQVKAKSQSIGESITLDKSDIKIARLLLKNPDLKSHEISSALGIPLSTIQRRRTRLERTVLQKRYEFDMALKGYRLGALHMKVGQGRTEEAGTRLLKDIPDSILKVSTTVNSSTNLVAEIIYPDSETLHHILEKVRAIPSVSRVDWWEVAKVIGDNTVAVVDTLLDKGP